MPRPWQTAKKRDVARIDSSCAGCGGQCESRHSEGNTSNSFNSGDASGPSWACTGGGDTTIHRSRYVGKRHLGK